MNMNKVPQNLRMTNLDKNLAFTLDPTKSEIADIAFPNADADCDTGWI